MSAQALLGSTRKLARPSKGLWLSDVSVGARAHARCLRAGWLRCAVVATAMLVNTCSTSHRRADAARLGPSLAAWDSRAPGGATGSRPTRSRRPRRSAWRAAVRGAGGGTTVSDLSLHADSRAGPPTRRAPQLEPGRARVVPEDEPRGGRCMVRAGAAARALRRPGRATVTLGSFAFEACAPPPRRVRALCHCAPNPGAAGAGARRSEYRKQFIVNTTSKLQIANFGRGDRKY